MAGLPAQPCPDSWSVTSAAAAAATAHLVPGVPLRVDQQVDVLELLILLSLSHPGVVDPPPALAVSDKLLLHARLQRPVHLTLHLQRTWYNTASECVLKSNSSVSTAQHKGHDLLLSR